MTPATAEQAFLTIAAIIAWLAVLAYLHQIINTQPAGSLTRKATYVLTAPFALLATVGFWFAVDTLWSIL